MSKLLLFQLSRKVHKCLNTYFEYACATRKEDKKIWTHGGANLGNVDVKYFPCPRALDPIASLSIGLRNSTSTETVSA